MNIYKPVFSQAGVTRFARRLRGHVPVVPDNATRIQIRQVAEPVQMTIPKGYLGVEATDELVKAGVIYDTSGYFYNSIYFLVDKFDLERVDKKVFEAVKDKFRFRVGEEPSVDVLRTALLGRLSLITAENYAPKYSEHQAEVEVAVDALMKGNLKKWADFKEQWDRLNGPTIDLSGADLNGMYFPEVNFNGVDFSGANFTDANLFRASCVGAKFRGAIFNKTKADYANIKGADFSKAHIEDLTATDPEFEGAILRGAKIGIFWFFQGRNSCAHKLLGQDALSKLAEMGARI